MAEYEIGAAEIRVLLTPIHEADRDVSETEEKISDAIVDTADEMEKEDISISFGHFLWVEGLVYRALRTQDDEDAEMALRALADVRDGHRVQIVKLTRKRLD